MLARAGAAAMQSSRRAPAPGPWDPGDIAGYAFDFDGESYAGGMLLDISGNGRDLSQADVAKRPAQVSRNGRLALEYTGGMWLRGSMGSPLAQPMTVYVVAELTSQTGNDYVHDGDTNASFALQHLAASNTWRVGTGGVFISGGPSSVSPFCSCAVLNSATSTHWMDDFRTGQEVASGNAGAAGLAEMTLGSRSDGAGGLRGFIWRVIGYSGAHDAPTRKLMGDYLAARYSIPIVT